MASISIHWAGLWQVAEVAFAFGVGIVLTFTLGALGMSRVETARTAPSGSATRLSGLAVAGVAFAACAAAAVYGLYLLIPQFHK